MKHVLLILVLTATSIYSAEEPQDSFVLTQFPLLKKIAIATAPKIFDDICPICREYFSTEDAVFHFKKKRFPVHENKNTILYSPACNKKYNHFVHRDCWNTWQASLSVTQKAKCLYCMTDTPETLPKYFPNTYYKSPLFHDLKENPYLQVQLHSELKKLAGMNHTKEKTIRLEREQTRLHIMYNELVAARNDLETKNDRLNNQILYLKVSAYSLVSIIGLQIGLQIGDYLFLN